MTAKNDHTGDLLQSRMNTKAFEENVDRIFRKPLSHDELVSKMLENPNVVKELSYIKDHLTFSIEENVELCKQLSQVDYEYELNKATGDVEKAFKDGVSKPNESQFDGN